MFDIYTVQRIAFDNKMYELVMYILRHPEEYCHFIMTGKGLE